MPPAVPDAVELGGLLVPDARTGEPVDLDATPAFGVLTIIRRRC